VDVQAGGPYLSDKTHRPDLVILTPVRPLDRVLVNELIALGIPHLLVAAFEGHGCVGPLVLPGQTACLHCLDLARRDRDPAWPIVTARLGGYPPGEIACDAVLASLVAAAATGHALAHLEGREAVVTNGTMDVFPDWHWERRSWVMHPQCRCTRNNPHPRTMVMSATCD
jgi:bacteriocin biosynthesis cyclodehydratase domain-containing protein